MAWGFRKSRKFGGVRFTFSKSGVSASVGVPGFRVSTGSRGVYVTTGAGGFYYRQRIDAPSRRPERGRQPTAPAEPFYEPDGVVETVWSAGVEALTGVTQAEFVEELNRVTRRGAIQIVYVCGAVVLLVLAVYAGVSAFRLLACTMALCLGFVVARSIERRRRRFLLVYDLDERIAGQFAELEGALDAAAASHSLRAVSTIESIGSTRRKYHGGAGHSLAFIPAALGRAAPPSVQTNVAPHCLTTQRKQIYFFPDRLVILENHRFAAVGYDELDVRVNESSFQWEGALPRDAEVIGQTYRYTNKDGGPDRRFAGNYAIPIVRTGELTLRSVTGLHVCVQTTRPDALHAVAVAIHALVGNHAANLEGPDRSIPAPLRSALAAFGFSEIPSRSALVAAYRELARRNHPDKHASDATEIRAFVEERMKEINAAFTVLKPLAEANAERAVASDASSEPSVSGTPRSQAMTRLRELASEPYVRSPILGLVGCLAIAASTWWVEQAFPTSPNRTHKHHLIAVRSGEPEVIPTQLETTPSTRRCPLRREPSSSAVMLSWLPAGAPVQVLERAGGWRRVRLDGSEGWMGDFCWTRGNRHPRVEDPPSGAGAATPEAFTNEASVGSSSPAQEQPVPNAGVDPN